MTPINPNNKLLWEGKVDQLHGGPLCRVIQISRTPPRVMVEMQYGKAALGEPIWHKIKDVLDFRMVLETALVVKSLEGNHD